MFGFFRPARFEDPQLGAYHRVGRMWIPSSTGSGLTVVLEGDKHRPSSEALALARQLLAEPAQRAQAAKAFVQADAQAHAFIAGHGDLVCEGFTVDPNGRFAVEFSLTGWDDAMVSVHFDGAVLCTISLGD